MLFFAYFCLGLLLFLQALILYCKGKQSTIDLIKASLLALLGLPFVGTVFSELSERLLLKSFILLGLLITIGWSLAIRLRRQQKSPFSWLPTTAMACFGLILLGVHALRNLHEQQPILKVTMTGNTQVREMEWKPVRYPLQKAFVPVYEVLLQHPETNALLERFFLPGDVCAVRVKLLRFHPLLNALGMHNKYCLDLIYSGYRKAEDQAKRPAEIYPISVSSFNSWFFACWERFFSMNAASFWIRCASLESHYVPLLNEHGQVFKGEYLLSVSNTGILTNSSHILEKNSLR
jgi:hypothetical protein